LVCFFSDAQMSHDMACRITVSPLRRHLARGFGFFSLQSLLPNGLETINPGQKVCQQL
jgi:hypothetical protein